jgi:hypothetical protein
VFGLPEVCTQRAHAANQNRHLRNGDEEQG